MPNWQEVIQQRAQAALRPPAPVPSPPAVQAPAPPPARPPAVAPPPLAPAPARPRWEDLEPVRCRVVCFGLRDWQPNWRRCACGRDLAIDPELPLCGACYDRRTAQQAEEP